MLKSLLDWARLQKDDLPVDMEIIDLKEIANTSMALNESLGQTKKVRIRNTINDVKVISHKNTLLTVFNNLLTNAIKFSHPEDEVSFSSCEENNHVNIIIEDHGIGLSKSEINQLFRIDVDPRKIGDSKEKGTGMGLILCKELLEKIKGSIQVESILGKGSKFIVTLPAN